MKMRNKIQSQCVESNKQAIQCGKIETGGRQRRADKHPFTENQLQKVKNKKESQIACHLNGCFCCSSV